jgi:hypothetical protein
MAICSVAAVGAQSEAFFWSFLKPGTVLSRCADATQDHKEASAVLTSLHQRISQSRDSDDPAKAVDDLHRLLKTECFLPAAETQRVPRPDTNLSLREWWTNGGGFSWLSSFLELPEYGLSTDLKPHIVVPADTRRTLNLDGHRDHPLQNLLCALGDASCGTVTKGWKLRADAYFDAHHALDRSSGAWTNDERPPSGISVVSRQCTEQASGSDPASRYQVWRQCIEGRREKRIALPLGDFKAPAAGWIFISGRRGHYDFCDTTRAYDLDTGAAFISDRCSALVLRTDGSVDQDATKDLAVNDVKSGTLSIETFAKPCGSCCSVVRPKKCS